MKNFKMKSTFAVGAASILTLATAGCGSSAPVNNTSSTQPAPKPTVSAVLNVGNFGAYLPKDILTQFEAKYHTHINYATYTTNPELLAKMQAGDQFDVAVASDWMVDTMIHLSLLSKIDYQYVPNIKNIDANMRQLAFDPTGDYSVPYLYGATAIAVNTGKVKTKVTTWTDLLNPEFKNKLVVPDDSRDMIGTMLIINGHNLNDAVPADLNQAASTLSKFRPQVKVFDSDQPHVELLNGEATAGIVWTGEGAQAYSQNPKILPVYPDTGMQKWVDNMVIPTNAANKYTAELFINFLLDPKISAELENDQEYSDPNFAAKPYIDPALLSNPWVELPASVVKNGEVELALTAQNQKLYSQIWTNFKAQ